MTATRRPSCLMLPHGGPPDAPPRRSIRSAQGVRAIDCHGVEYLDAAGGLDGVSLGYAHPSLVLAATDQLGRLSATYAGSGRAADVTETFATQLVETFTGFRQAHFESCDSAAVDTAIRFARYHHYAHGQRFRNRILAVSGSLYGHTGYSAAASSHSPASYGFADPSCSTAHLRAPRDRRVPGSYADIDELLAEVRDTVLDLGPDTIAACLLEPVQTAAGVIVPPSSYLLALRELLTSYGILLIVDETVTGLRRTGPMSAAAAAGLDCDLLVLGPALTSGHVPLAAVLATAGVADAIAAGADVVGGFGHGGATSGHPVACAVAARALQIIEAPETARHVAALTSQLAGLAARHRRPGVREIRQEGLLLAYGVAQHGRMLPYDTTAYRIAEEAAANGLLVRAYPGSVVFAPPLNTTATELDDMFERWDRTIAPYGSVALTS